VVHTEYEQQVSCQQCTRCGSTEHGTANCTKPFLRPVCSHCNRAGHLASDCFVKRRQEREANHQKWEAQKAEREAARQKREAQKAEREANRQKREAQKAEREADPPKREAQKAEEKVDRKRDMKADDAESVCSSSTMASCTDKVARVQARHKCGFCGAQQAEPKAKKGVNMCRDRCQSCFRPLTKQ